MTYLSINEKTAEGRRLIAVLEKNNAVVIHKKPNEATRQALRDAKAGKGKKIKDVNTWLDNLLA